MPKEVCPLCNNFISSQEESSCLTEKGIESLKSANDARQDEPISFKVGQRIHKTCRIQYCHKREIRKYIEGKVDHYEKKTIEVKNLRSTNLSFSFASDCFLCGSQISCDGEKVHTVQSLDFKDTLLSYCKARNDSWSMSVEHRLLSVIDLPAVNARYHGRCY